jgi:hypothetical protein
MLVFPVSSYYEESQPQSCKNILAQVCQVYENQNKTLVKPIPSSCTQEMLNQIDVDRSEGFNCNRVDDLSKIKASEGFLEKHSNILVPFVLIVFSLGYLLNFFGPLVLSIFKLDSLKEKLVLTGYWALGMFLPVITFIQGILLSPMILFLILTGFSIIFYVLKKLFLDNYLNAGLWFRIMPLTFLIFYILSYLIFVLVTTQSVTSL